MSDRVLFVDDDPHLIEAFKRIFRNDEIEVVTAQSGPEALMALEAAEIAVVVSDERMPGMTGSELLEKVRESHPDTIRIMLTGYATLELALDAINRAEVFRFLLKPCSFIELGNVVREAIERRRATRQQLRAEAPQAV